MDTNKNNSEFNQKIERKALIIADTFTSLFSPINNEISECLLPICNIPIIEYMFDFLFSNSITEIIICAAKNADTLKSYLKKYHHKNNQIKLITSDSKDEFQTLGDCMRKVNIEKLITSDFVLIRGLVIANFNLEDAFKFHVAKRKADPYVLITTIMKRYKNDKMIKTRYDENFLIVNKQTNRILQYESIQCGDNFIVNKNVKFNLSKPKSANEIPVANQYQIKTGLYDTFIDICSADILNHFSENFDYHTIRDDLIKNIMVNEIFLDIFMLYELGVDQYSAVARNVESYLKINNEIINRWAHPIVIEKMNLPVKLKTLFKVTAGNTYFDGANVKIGKNVKYSNSNVFGADSKIEENSDISNSVLGKNVSVGRNCRIKNSVIFPNVKIHDNVILENSIVGKNTEIKENLVVKFCYIANDLNLNFPGEEGKVLSSLRIDLDNNEDIISDEEDDDVDLYNENVEVNKENSNKSASFASDKEKVVKLEMTENENFLMNLNDKDYMYAAIQANEQAEENYEENEEDDFDEFTESEEEDELDEDYDEEMKGIVSAGIEDSVKINDVVQEIMALKFSFKYKTFSDSNLI